MIKRIGGAAALTVALALGAGTAHAVDSAFDSSTPPAPAPWMARPCLKTPDGIQRSQNCYWNETMGMAVKGFWSRKIPGEPVVCYFFSDPANGDFCAPTTQHQKWFTKKLYYARGDG